MKIYKDIYKRLTSIENIYFSFLEFRKDKKRSSEILKFERYIEDNLFSIYDKLKNKAYIPGEYSAFRITDPKMRLIHKAPLEDRIIHHVLCRGLEEIYEPIFIAHSYSCRKNKGTHKGVRDLFRFTKIVSRNNTRACWALKCDIRKFFASVDQNVLLEILNKKIKDDDYLNILKLIIYGFNLCHENVGLPIGNLTSQYFANIYMNEFDQFVKHKLKVKYYIRYTDDFIILSQNKNYLTGLLDEMRYFLKYRLKIELHPDKIKFYTLKSGIDFLGYIVFPYHILPRHKTKKRIFRKIRQRIAEVKNGELSYDSLYQVIQSYLGFFTHCNSFRIREEIENLLQGSKVQNPRT